MDENEQSLFVAPEQLTHEAVRVRLPSFVARELLQRDASIAFPAIAKHLANCANCHSEMELLLALSAPLYTGEIEPTTPKRSFDLSFLKPASIQWVRERAGRLALHFSTELLPTLLLPRPSGLPSTAMAARASTGSSGHTVPAEPLYRHHEQVAGSVAGEMTEITVEVFADAAPYQAYLQISIDRADRDPFEQGGMPVQIQIGGELYSATTDDTGRATFPHLPQSQLHTLHISLDLATTR